MRFTFVISEIFQNLRRNISMVISVVLVTFISLTFVGVASMMQMQITQMKGFWYDRAQVVVYMCSPYNRSKTCSSGAATHTQIDAVKERLESPALSQYVERFYFENHQQAYENFSRQFANSGLVDITLPEMLDEAYWVKLKEHKNANVVLEGFTGIPGVSVVKDQRTFLDQIFAFLNVASITAVAVAVLMLVAAVMLIATTVRLSAYSRRRELGIMRLVGASNLFVQTPFVLEGVIAGGIGALLAGGAVLGIAQFFVSDYLVREIPSISFIGLQEALFTVPLLLVVGVVLAAISAKMSISRSLKT